MDANELLLWIAGPMLALLSLHGVAQARHREPWLLALTLAIAAVGAVVWLLAPAATGAVTAALLAVFVILPGVAMARLFQACDARRWRAARMWLAFLAALQSWLPGRRRQLASMRWMIALETGKVSAPPDERAWPAQAAVLARDARWDELAALLDAHREALAGPDPGYRAMRLRCACELGDWDTVLRWYEPLAARGEASWMHRRALHGARVALAAAAGQADGVAALCAASPVTAHDDVAAYFIAWARWARGEEAEARVLLEHVVANGTPRLRAASSSRLARPPVPAADLPPRVRELGTAIAQRACASATTPRRPLRLASALIAANVAVYAGIAMAGGDRADALMRIGALSSTAVARGEWWRLGASLFLHVDLMHLAMNMLGLLLFANALERRAGWVRVLPIYLLAGLAGNLLCWGLAIARGEPTLVVGASGCVMGLVGAMAVALVREWRAGGSAVGVRAIGLQILLQWWFDATHPQVAASAHFGGLVAGAVLGVLLLPKPQRESART